MLSYILLFFAIYGKLCLSYGPLDQFTKVDTGHDSLEITQPGNAAEVRQICEESDIDIINSQTPEELCAAECVNAPYFCHSFLLAYNDGKLSCYHFGCESSKVHMHLTDNPSIAKYRVRSQYEYPGRSDFVSSVDKLSRDFVTLFENEWADEVLRSYGSINPNIATRFISKCIGAAKSRTDIKLEDKFNRKSLISALKYWSSPNPASSASFDDLLLLFLKLYGQSMSHEYIPGGFYFGYDHHHSYWRTDTYVFVASFRAGHYVTITRGNIENDYVTYISADGNFDKATYRINAAVRVYLSKVKKFNPGSGTTLTQRHSRGSGISVDFVDLSQKDLGRPGLEQEAAVAVLGNIVSSLHYEYHLEFRNRLPDNMLRDMVTFVLSWVYKIGQADLNVETSAVISTMGSSMLSQMKKGFFSKSLANVNTQH